MFIFLVIIWYLIGAISFLLFVWNIEKQIDLGTVVLSLIAGCFGLFIPCYMLFMFLLYKLSNIVLISRRK